MTREFGPIQDRIFVVCNGVDVNRYGRPANKELLRDQLGLGMDTRLIAVVGMFKAEKGHQYMIEAMPSIVSAHPDVCLLFIGDGELREELQSQIEEMGLEEHVRFLGRRHDVPELLAASDLFVLPSLWEGLSMALLEAMATGLPIVASEVSGAVQVLVHNETGLLVPPGDVRRLAQAVVQLLDDPHLAQTMGAAARRRVEEQYSAQKQADEYLALYRHMVQER